MLITADQIFCHLVGDYILQSDRMARLKRSSSWICLGHVIWYALPFPWLVHASELAWLAIVATHFAIDRWGLARYVVWAKNRVLGDGPPWSECTATGYPPDRPAWMAIPGWNVSTGAWQGRHFMSARHGRLAQSVDHDGSSEWCGGCLPPDPGKGAR